MPSLVQTFKNLFTRKPTAQQLLSKKALQQASYGAAKVAEKAAEVAAKVR